MVLSFTQQQQMDAAAAAYAAAQRQAYANAVAMQVQYQQSYAGLSTVPVTMATTTAMMPALPPNTTVVTNPNLLTERFKTKLCRNFMTNGNCGYGHRCMFAHGQHELRTTDMNVRDGLMTEEAIRSFQRAMTAHNHGELATKQGSDHSNAVQHLSDQVTAAATAAPRTGAEEHTNPFYAAFTRAHQEKYRNTPAHPLNSRGAEE